ncbi:diguanylate cyclase [Corallincola platygyrae]|uniref:diguanylate cyclase n=1 Tax=Corallincola platygyrae TaxID=1193278 RepID=A0ABW4XNK9_9GAMM
MMILRGLCAFRILAVLVLILPFSFQVTAEDIEARLKEAESRRLTSPELVSAIISELSQSNQLTTYQQSRLALLQAHQAAILGQYESAKLILSELFYRDLKSETELKAYHLLSQIADLESDYARAFSYLNYALQMLPKVASNEARIEILLLASDLFSRAEAHEKSIQYVEQAVALIESAPQINDVIKCQAADSVSVVYSQMGRADAAFRAAQKQLGICNLAAQRLLAANAHMVIARVYIERYALKQALEEFQKAEAEFDALGYRYGMLNARLQIGSLMASLSRTDEARNYLLSVIPDAMENNLWDELRDSFLLIAGLSEDVGEYQEAIIYYKQYMAAVKTVMDDDKSLRMAYLQTEFETEQQAQQVEILEKDKTLLTLREQSINQQRWLLAAFLVVAALVMIVLVLVLARYRMRNDYYRQLSEVDGLTKVFNRRHAYDHGEKLLKSSIACGEPFAVVMADIDHFKQVNDSYGHRVGDRVLQAVANQLKQGLRGHDILARAGGEEFVMFLPRANYSQAIHIAERCRESLQPVNAGERDVTVTLSFGISISEGRHIGLSSLVEEADKALYASKNNGRNRISLYRDLLIMEQGLDGKQQAPAET